LDSGQNSPKSKAGGYSRCFVWTKCYGITLLFTRLSHFLPLLEKRTRKLYNVQKVKPNLLIFFPKEIRLTPFEKVLENGHKIKRQTLSFFFF
jgi:hypothetical protein